VSRSIGKSAAGVAATGYLYLVNGFTQGLVIGRFMILIASPDVVRA